jgi:ssDNA-binding Zn-finger/Zn-ribbon topoisomerase 1
MLLRFNREDLNPFWGCSGYPKCKATKGLTFERENLTKLAQIMAMLQHKVQEATSPLAEGIPETMRSIRKLAELMETIAPMAPEHFVMSEAEEDEGIMSTSTVSSPALSD